MAACVWQYSLRLQIICSIHFWLDWNDGRCLANSLFNQDKTRSSFNNLAILFQTVYGIYQTTTPYIYKVELLRQISPIW